MEDEEEPETAWPLALEKTITSLKAFRLKAFKNKSSMNNSPGAGNVINDNL